MSNRVIFVRILKVGPIVMDWITLVILVVRVSAWCERVFCTLEFVCKIDFTEDGRCR